MIIVGLGTGRCGTRSLAGLLQHQAGISVSHERHPPLAWSGDDPMKHFRGIPPERNFSDIGFYYLPYVEELREQIDDIRFICLQREREATITSFCGAPNRDDDWFKDGGKGWSKSFPNYDCEFEEAVGRYYDDYYARAEELAGRDFRIFPTETLNSPSGIEEVLDFCRVRTPLIVSGINVTDRKPLEV